MKEVNQNLFTMFQKIQVYFDKVCCFLLLISCFNDVIDLL